MSENYGDSFANITGSILDSEPNLTIATESSSALNGVVANLALFKQEIQNAIISAYNNLSPQTAEEIVLDAYASRTGLARRGATSTVYVCNVVISSPCVLQPEDDTFTDGIYRTSTEGNIYQAQYTPVQVYSFNESGTFQIQVECTTTGVVVSELNKITIIEKPKAGLDSVTNIRLLSVGADKETQQAFNARYMSNQQLAQGRSGTVESIKQLLESDTGGGCDRAIFIDNTTVVKMYDKIPAGCGCVICYGGNNDAIFNTLKPVIYGALYAEPGISNIVYAQDKSHTDKYGNTVAGDSYPVIWNTAKPQVFTIKVKITGQHLDEETAFINYVTDYVNTHRVCDFIKTIYKNDVLLGALVFFNQNFITNSGIYDVTFLENGIEKTNIEPSDCFSIPVLETVLVEYV